MSDTHSWAYLKRKMEANGVEVSPEVRLRAAHEQRMQRMSPEDKRVLQRAAELRLEREIRKANHVAR